MWDSLISEMGEWVTQHIICPFLIPCLPAQSWCQSERHSCPGNQEPCVIGQSWSAWIWFWRVARGTSPPHLGLGPKPEIAAGSRELVERCLDRAQKPNKELRGWKGKYRVAWKQVQSLATARCAVDAACTLLVSPFRVVAGAAQSILWRILFVVGTFKRPAPASCWHPKDFDVFAHEVMLFAFRQLT